MPARGSSFPRTELLLLLLAFPLFTAGCGPRLIWGIPEGELKAQLAKSRYDALAPVDFPSQDPDACLAISPDAPFYLSFVFDSLGRPVQSLRMLELAWQKCPSPWKEEAGVLLAQRSLSEKDYDRAVDVARGLLTPSASADVTQRARRALVAALYWKKDDAAALQEAERLEGPDPEVLLFRAVSSLRLEMPAAHDLILQLFLKEKVSSLHGRAYTFLAAEPAYLQQFSQPEHDLLAGKNSLVQGDWSRAIKLLEEAFDQLDPRLFADSSLVVDLGSAYVYSGKSAAGARSMEKLAGRLTGPARIDALEYAGRLYRRARDHARALPLLQKAAAEAGPAVQRDRARWLILDSLFATDPGDLSRLVQQEAAAWNDTSYFTDLLQSRIAELVTARKWRTLVGLWRALEDSGPASVRAQLSYILAREWQEGMIPRLPGMPPVTARALFQDAARRDPSGYYGILSASILGDLPDRAIPAPQAAASAPAAPLDPIALGFLPFGLTSQAYARLWAARDGLDDAQVLEAARRFAQAQDYRSSLYFVGALSRRHRLSIAELQMYYPRAFAGLVEPMAAGAGIPEHILYGLVREESYFDPDIVSSAGAVGLSQLMPSTAAAVARGLRISDPDLRDPVTNLTIGVRHFRDLMSSAGSTTKALLAYNAGLTRLRQWERASPGVPLDLLVESAAIAETREYVRKILVSSVMYAFLYRDADPREAALSFFGIGKKALEPEPDLPGRGRAIPR